MPDEILIGINTKQWHSQSPSAIVNHFASEAWVDSDGIVHQQLLRGDTGDLPAIVVIYDAVTTQAVYNPVETQAAAWGAKFVQLTQLRDGWNGYDAPAPSAKAILTAQGFVETLLSQKYEPKRVAPSAVGGVGITQRNRNKKVYVEFFNDGKVFALFSDGNSEPVSKEIIPGHQAFKALIKEMQEYLDA